MSPRCLLCAWLALLPALTWHAPAAAQTVPPTNTRPDVTDLVFEAPQPPEFYFRLDVFKPGYVFTNGIQPPWSRRVGQNAMVNNDLLSTLQRKHADSNWLAYSSSRDAMLWRMQRFTTLPTPPRVVWLYTVQPTAYSYNMVWAMREYTERAIPGHEARVAAVKALPNWWNYHNSWASLGGVDSGDVLQGASFEYNQLLRSYVGPTQVVINPAFRRSPPPQRATSNPLEIFAPPTLADSVAPVYVMEPTISASAEANGTMRLPDSPMPGCSFWTSGNTTPAAQSKASRQMDGGAEDDEDTCPAYVGHVQVYTDSRLARPTPLAFKLHSGTYCIAPEIADGYVGTQLVSCERAPQDFEYDEYQRLALFWKNNYWCLAAPLAVFDPHALSSWDVVRMEPCVVNDTRQQWLISDGKIYSYKGNFPLREFGRPILSRARDANLLRIDKGRFARGFFDGPSPARSYAVELAMAWDFNGSTYYSTIASSSPWSAQYTSRSYYDYLKQTIGFIDLGSTQRNPPSVPGRRCLKSRQVNNPAYNWDWTEWADCDDRTGPVPPALRWKLDSLAKAIKDPRNVRWRDSSGKPLWTVAWSRAKAGFHFTALTDRLEYYGSSTRDFSIRPDALRLDLTIDTNQ